MSSFKTILNIGFIISILINLLFINKWLNAGQSSYIISEDEITIDFAFSGLLNDPKTLLLEAINKADETLDIAIYNLKDREVAQAVLYAKEQGVKVRIITDADKAEKDSQAAILDEFISNGIFVKVNKLQKMHLKMVIIDGRKVVTGSYNFTEESAYENLEQLLTLTNHELVTEWAAIFEGLWNRGDYEMWTNSMGLNMIVYTKKDDSSLL